MSSFIRSWEDAASYIEATKGYKYLDNPTGWVDAMKELLSDSRYVGDDNFYNPNGFNWTSVGDYVRLPETGLKSIPVEPTVITNTVTGAVEAGATAAALEATGITITLTTAGWLATCLTGLGLGVAAYEAAPEFWTDLSNAVFEPITGEHLTYDKTEPFLRKKISALMSTDNNGKIVTYVDKAMTERAYNFIKTHITEVGGTASWADDYTWYDWTGSAGPGRYQRCDSIYSGNVRRNVYVTEASLTDDMLQACEHNCKLMLERHEIDEDEYSCNGLINNLRSLYPNYNNCNMFVASSYRMYSDGSISQRYISINGWRETLPEDNMISFKMRGIRSLREGINAAQATADDYAYSGTPYISGSEIDSIHPVFAYKYDFTTQVGVVKEGSSYDGVNLWPMNGIAERWGDSRVYCSGYSNIMFGEDKTDNYLQRNGVVTTGKAPVSNKTLDERYPGWIDNKKTTGQPGKNGNVVTDRLPLNVPMGSDIPDKVIKHGVNNPNDPDSYDDNQDDNQEGKDTPSRNPISSFNDITDENIEEYNDSRTTPGSFPEPEPPGVDPPDYPPDPPSDPGGDSGDTPTPADLPGVTASGMVSVYNPTKTEVKNFSAWLWTDNVIDNLKKILANPIDAIIGMHILYVTPVTGSPENIICGYLDSGVAAKVVTQQYIDIDCGYIDVPEYYGNATDYEPYTTLHIYLPFVGIQSLKANDVIGKRLYVSYGVDVLTGTCLARLTTKKDDSDICCYQFAGNCAVQVPLTGGSYAEIIKGIASMTVGVAGSVMTANPLPAIGGVVAGAMGSSLDVSRSGSLGANAGVMGIRKPYLIITRRKAYNASIYSQFYGFPANATVKLGTCKGYTRVKSVHVDSIGVATDTEITEIEALLKQGVIIK